MPSEKEREASKAIEGFLGMRSKPQPGHRLMRCGLSKSHGGGCGSWWRW